MSLSHFEDLANSPKLFACPDCFQTVHEAVICQLQSEVAALKDVVAVLSDKLHLLKTTIAISQPISESIESTAKKLDRHQELPSLAMTQSCLELLSRRLSRRLCQPKRPNQGSLLIGDTTS